MHLGVQRDDPVVEDRGHAGQIGQVGGGDPGGDDGAAVPPLLTMVQPA